MIDTPAATINRSGTFPERYELIRGELLESFMQSAWPIDVYVNFVDAAQTVMQTGIIRGKETRLAQHGLRLGFIPVMDKNPGPNRTAV